MHITELSDFSTQYNVKYKIRCITGWMDIGGWIEMRIKTVYIRSKRLNGCMSLDRLLINMHIYRSGGKGWH